MELSDYASLFATDTLVALQDIFSTQPDIADLSFAGTPYVGMIRAMLRNTEVTCYADDGTVVGMRMRSPMGVVSFMPEPFRSTILTHLSGILPLETFSLLEKVLPIVATAAPALDTFLDTHGFGLARAALRSLGFDVWAFLVAGFAPDFVDGLFDDSDDEDAVSPQIMEAWAEFIHTL
jgi:hypothetical protein